MDKSKSRLGLMRNLDSALSRLRLVGEAAVKLRRFRDIVGQVERTPNTAGHMLDETRDAENSARIIMALALDSMNVLHSSGAMTHIIRDSRTQNSDQIALKESLDGVDRFFKERYPDLDLHPVLREAAELIDRYRITIEPDKQGVVVKYLKPDGKIDERFMPADRGKMRLGRVSVDDVFSNRPLQWTLANKTDGSKGCHHDEQSVGKKDGTNKVDYYQAMVSGVMFTRDVMAHHTALCEYYGNPHARGDDPAAVATVVVIAMIVGAVLFVAGATITIGCSAGAWDGDICNWGFALILIGAALGFMSDISDGRLGDGVNVPDELEE